MTYPFDQLSGLAKANLDFSLTLADIARRAGQESLQGATTLVAILGEAAQAGANHEGKAAVLSGKGTDLLRDAEKLREQMLADTRAAFEAWRAAWSAAIVLPHDTKSIDAFSTMLNFWQSPGSTKSAAGKTE